MLYWPSELCLSPRLENTISNCMQKYEPELLCARRTGYYFVPHRGNKTMPTRELNKLQKSEKWKELRKINKNETAVQNRKKSKKHWRKTSFPLAVLMCFVRCFSFYNWVGSCSKSWSCNSDALSLLQPRQSQPAPFPGRSTLLPAESGSCALVCTECEKVPHTFRLKRDIIIRISHIFLLLFS